MNNQLDLWQVTDDSNFSEEYTTNIKDIEYTIVRFEQNKNK